MESTRPPSFDPVRGQPDALKVLARDKFVGKSFQWLLAIPGLSCVLLTLACLVWAMLGSAAATALTAGAVSAAFAVLFGFMWATLSVVRTVLTTDALHVKIGLWGPRIELDRIESCQIVQEAKRLTVGKRYEDGQWFTRYVMAAGDQVEVAYRDEEGAKHTLRFTAEDPGGVVAAVQRVRGLRIDTGVASSATEDAAEAAQEAEAVEEAAAAEAATERSRTRG